MIQTQRSPQYGFTLIEILMVVAIFSLAVLMSVNVFLTATRSQRDAQSQQRVQSDARFTLETMAREIRNSIPNYALYGDPNADTNVTDAFNLSDPTHVLALCDSSNITCDPTLPQTIVRQVSANAANPWAGGGTRLEICSTDCQQTGSWADITPTGVTVTRFEVWVTPRYSPLLLKTDGSGNFQTDVQSMVTIILSVREQAQAGLPAVPSQVYQTSVTSRLFLR
jgi:prepilin-type N-terminal cleavage/methylation domain-containing protein